MLIAANSTVWEDCNEWKVWQSSGKKWRNRPSMIISCIASFTAKHHSRQIPVSGSHFRLGCGGGQFYCSTSTELVLVCLVVQWSGKWASKTSPYRSEQLSWGKVLIHFFELSFQQTHFLQWFSFGVCLLFCRWVMAVKNSLFRWIVHIWCARCQFTEKEQKLSFERYDKIDTQKSLKSCSYNRRRCKEKLSITFQLRKSLH